MIGYVYITTNLINNKKYIGLKTSEIFIESYLGSGKIIKKAIIKYGTENFEVEILEECETIEELKECERKWIKNCNAQKDSNYYNIAEGGQWGNCIEGMSENEKTIYKKNLSQGVKNSYINNPLLRGRRAEQRKSMKGNIVTSDKTRKLISESSKKIWKENYDKMSEIMRNTIAKNKENGVYKKTWKTHKHPWIGKQHSDESKKKISEHIDNHGIKNPNCKNGIILFNEETVYIFQITLDAHEFLKEKGFTRRDRYKMIHGEQIRGYRIQREGQTTIENTTV